MINRISYAIKQGFKQIVRNGTMTFASLFSITAMLLLLGVFFVALTNINMLMNEAKEQYNQVQLYLQDSVSYDTSQLMMENIGNMDNVETVSYLSKDEGMAQWKKKWGDNAYMLDWLPENPLPNTIIINVADIEKMDAVASAAGQFDGVEDVRYYKDAVKKLTSVTHAISLAGWIIIAFLIVICVVVVSNTVKLTVFARAEEIEIMKYIGATNWFVRGPFLVEGVAIGMVSALIAAGLCALMYIKIVETIGPNIFMIFRTSMVPADFLMLNLVQIFIAIGISVGACGSIISMRRFLDK